MIEINRVKFIALQENMSRIVKFIALQENMSRIVKFIALQENMSRNIKIHRCRIRWETLKLKPQISVDA